MNFETVKRNFERKLWSKAMVKTAVKKGIITREEFEKITGEKYK